MGNTRELILHEALKLFLEKGYHGASMRHLARRVGIRGSSIYNHFKNKAEIYNALINQASFQLAGLQEGIDLLRQTDLSPSTVIRDYMERISEIWFNENNARLFLFFIRESSLLAPVGTSHHAKNIRKALKPLADYFSHLQQQQQMLSDFQPFFLAWELIAPLANLRLNLLLPHADTRDREQGYELIQMHIQYFIRNNLPLR